MAVAILTLVGMNEHVMVSLEIQHDSLEQIYLSD